MIRVEVKNLKKERDPPSTLSNQETVPPPSQQKVYSQQKIKQRVSRQGDNRHG